MTATRPLIYSPLTLVVCHCLIFYLTLVSQSGLQGVPLPANVSKRSGCWTLFFKPFCWGPPSPASSSTPSPTQVNNQVLPIPRSDESSHFDGWEKFFPSAPSALQVNSFNPEWNAASEYDLSNESHMTKPEGDTSTTNLQSFPVTRTTMSSDDSVGNQDTLTAHNELSNSSDGSSLDTTTGRLRYVSHDTVGLSAPHMNESGTDEDEESEEYSSSFKSEDSILGMMNANIATGGALALPFESEDESSSLDFSEEMKDFGHRIDAKNSNVSARNSDSGSSQASSKHVGEESDGDDVANPFLPPLVPPTLHPLMSHPLMGVISSRSATSDDEASPIRVSVSRQYSQTSPLEILRTSPVAMIQQQHYTASANARDEESNIFDMDI